MSRYYSHGKLLISGEYLVLAGAEALAVPTRFGQYLQHKEKQSEFLDWLALDCNGNSWFSCRFDVSNLTVVETTDSAISNQLSSLLLHARQLNEHFLQSGGNVECGLEFNRHWGLGSSSTLICNIAKWAEVDAFDLSSKSFGGSGYDVAVGMVGSELLYSYPPAWESFVWNIPFKRQLYFVYMNQKQNSRDALKQFKLNDVNQKDVVRVSEISRAMIECNDFDTFQLLVDEHEHILSGALQMPGVRTQYFKDYPYAMKSLGAWGGDFILACGDENTKNYFASKGYDVCLHYSEIIKF